MAVRPGHRRRRLGRALQRADVEGVERFVGQAQRHLLGLVTADVGERGIALALDELERLALERVGRCAVPHQHDLGRSGWADVSALAERARGCGHGRRV